MRLPHFKKKFIAGALAAGLVMGAGGIAAAYFTAGGTGTGSATVGHATRFTVSGGTVTGLLPGSPKTATFTVFNPNGFIAHFSGATASVTARDMITTVTHGATCLITVGTPSPTSASVAATTSTTVTVKVSMTTNATFTQGGCSATVHLTL